MSVLTALGGGVTTAVQKAVTVAATPRKLASPVTQTGTLTFAASSANGVDSTVGLGSVGLDPATTRLTASVALKAGTKYTFSFWFAKNGPTVTLIDSQGKSTKVNMASGFTATKSGNYQLVFDAPYSLKTAANFDNLSINATALLPTSSGDKNIDALLMGGTDQWWHPADAAPAKGSGSVSPAATGLDGNSSATTLTFGFLSSQPGGQSMTSFQAMTDAQKNAVRAAFAYYGKLINVNFTEVAGDGAANINFGTNNQGSSAGYAYLPNDSGTKDKTYMYLANNQATNSDAGVQQGGYGWMTVLHEIGHTLGLKHPGNYNAGGGGTPGPYLPAATDARQYTIMSYKDDNASRGINATTPMLYDVAALQYLYGANTSASAATSGKFTFSDGNSYLQTLWSANGTDTIDLSGLKNSSKVDLNSGAYSSINITGAATSSTYSGNNNVAIAYAAKINNVTLSSTGGVADSVTLNNAFVSGSYDTVGSFDASVDTIALKSSLFGKLSKASIEVGSAATAKNTRIVVNNATGDIYYDADGSGKGAAKKIAHYSVISGGAALSASNFSFVA
jgi:hypothetical protein